MVAKTAGSTPRESPSGYHWAATLHTTAGWLALAQLVELVKCGDGEGGTGGRLWGTGEGTFI